MLVGIIYGAVSKVFYVFHLIHTLSYEAVCICLIGSTEWTNTACQEAWNTRRERLGHVFKIQWACKLSWELFWWHDHVLLYLLSPIPWTGEEDWYFDKDETRSSWTYAWWRIQQITGAVNCQKLLEFSQIPGYDYLSSLLKDLFVEKGFKNPRDLSDMSQKVGMTF